MQFESIKGFETLNPSPIPPFHRWSQSGPVSKRQKFRKNPSWLYGQNHFSIKCLILVLPLPGNKPPVTSVVAPSPLAALPQAFSLGCQAFSSTPLF